MPIHSFSEEEQTPVLKRHNESQTKKNKIPELLRNYNSGWPLLQVSLYSVTNDAIEPIKYEPVLGGGTCHFFYIGAFNLASLLTKIPGNMEIITPYPITPKRELVKADNVLLFLRSFSIHHKSIGIKITSKSRGYCKSLSVDLPMGDESKFCDALTDIFSFALKQGASLKAIGGSNWNTHIYTQKQIEEAINPEVAVFQNGQIFIDLGMFLEQRVKDAEIIALFKHLFKIEPFLELQKKFPEFKPNSLKVVTEAEETAAKTLELTRPKSPSFFQEEKKETSVVDAPTLFMHS
ncbi:Uncharacterised protein [Legionella steigerwaltii]|uniref:Uncharacterized protein n=1 Tax=Legionella steigerwaltii TaxID=460 RepID=A0A378L578_9GAMM|nr:hypothetical protein [Legionella steigerwaltii]KTD78038.1 hypothetical protein Lstg_1319 [Legionella steigerwaltii]STY22225.1 Uncharacterised protein [Legionella steigerwaltii]